MSAEGRAGMAREVDPSDWKVSISVSSTALVAEINKPFEGTPSILISVSTIKGIGNKNSVTSAVVLQILRWLRRTPESFLIGSGTVPHVSETLLDPRSTGILRFDTRAIHAAFNTEHLKRGMIWKQVAEEMPGFTESMLTNLATDPRLRSEYYPN